MKKIILSLCLAGALVHGLRAFVSTSKVGTELTANRTAVAAVLSE